MRIIRSISFAIASSLYGIIPSIYDLFIRIASTEFFTADAIQEVSNNFYILISVCMLFAFGIKLISVIVNPDLFEDKKKGPAKTFVNAVIAVVLITVTPIAFKFMYQVQNNLVQNRIIEKIVFGLDPQSDVKAGNVLAAYTFRAFCYPKPEEGSRADGTISSVVGSASAKNYYKVLSGDMDALDEFGDDINNKTDGEWDFEYHILLSPLAGGYVAYELLLMTIDVAFRSIKLGLLQFIAPLVIIGFVFSGTDLLTRWLKEIVATFVLLFAKMAAIIFIIYGLSKFDEFIQNASVSDSIWLTGFIRVIFLIALLQLIKKLPDILNKIFGTDIKLSGGLGDRLSEMAGIGGLAKSALDKVKPVAGKALAGAGLLASGPLGWGAAAGAGALGYGWKRGFRGQQPWKDSGFGKGLRTFGAGAKGVWKGASTKGGIIKGIQEGIKDYGESQIANERKADKLYNIASNTKGTFGIGEDGRINSVRELSQSNNNQGATISAIQHTQALDSRIKSNLDSVHVQDDVTKLVQKLSRASRDKEVADAIKSKYESINNKLQSYIDSETDSVKQNNLRKIQGDYMRGAISSDEVKDKIKTLLGEGAYGSIKADSDKLQNLLKTTNENGMTFNDLLKSDGNSGIAIGKLGEEVTAITNTFDARKSDVEASKEKYKLNDYQKTALDKTVESVTTTAKAFADTQAKYYVDERTVNSSTQIPSNPSNNGNGGAGNNNGNGGN